MSRINCTRSGCKDVFHAFLIEKAEVFAGTQELPVIKPINQKPNRLITFSKALKTDDYDQWICFYEDDFAFERIWRNPKKYLPILRRFKGVISPDFSLYRDMPLVMQEWNIYRNRAIAFWLQQNEILMIPNIRWGDNRTYKASCIGYENFDIIAVGSIGCVKLLEDRKYFIEGLDYIVNRIKPKTIVVYGSTPYHIFDKYEKEGIEILRFDSSTSNFHKAGDA